MTAPAANRGPETRLRPAAPLARGTLDEVADARADPDADAAREETLADADDTLEETCAGTAPTAVAVETTARADETAEDARD